MEDQKVEQSAVETETTQVSSPATEVPTTGVQTTQEESVDQGSAVEGESNLPGMTEEQRRAFQEQRLEIKRLREEVASRKQSESAFAPFRTVTPPVSQQSDIRLENFIDPNTGLTDYTAYNHAVNQQIARAEQTARYTAQQTTQELIDENNARNKYPDLFNDPETEREIADRWLAAKMRGENPSIADIAGRVANRFQRAVSKAEKVGAEKALTEVTEKEKAGLSASGQTSEPGRQQLSAEEAENLSYQTRKGNYDAVASRLSKIPWANK